MSQKLHLTYPWFCTIPFQTWVCLNYTAADVQILRLSSEYITVIDNIDIKEGHLFDDFGPDFAAVSIP